MNTLASRHIKLISLGLFAFIFLASSVQAQPVHAAALAVTPQSLTSDSGPTLILTTNLGNPASSTVPANEVNVTPNVLLNSFSLTTGSNSITLNSIPAEIKTTRVTSASTLIKDIKLYEGPTFVGSINLATSTGTKADLSFSGLNLILPKKTTGNFTILADINPVDGTTVPNFSSALLSVQGKNLIASSSLGTVSVKGNANGNTQIFEQAPPSFTVAPSPTSATATAQNIGTTSEQVGTFSFVFTVTAENENFYVASTSKAFSLRVIDTTTGNATTSNNLDPTSTTNRTPTGNFLINSGQTVSFTLTAQKIGGAGHFYYAFLSSLDYGTSDSNPLADVVIFPSTYTTNVVQING